MQDDARIDAFVGRNAAYYRERWRAFGEIPRTTASFNWAAGIGQLLWLVYRKMHGAALVFLAVLVAHVSLFLYVDARALVPESVVTLANTIAALLYVAIPGFFGNYGYWRRFEKLDAQAASAGPDVEAQLRFLREHGGTANVGAALATALFAAPTLWAGYVASSYSAEGYVLDASGPLTMEELDANFLSHMDLELTEEQRACARREIEARAHAAGDPETLDPTTIELLPIDHWPTLDAFGRRLILAQVITTKAMIDCQ